MAIVQLTKAKYTGISRDIKPNDAPFGASFYEYDTEDIYDKTIDYPFNNGWKLRSNNGSTTVTEENASTIGGKITVKIHNNISYLVIMAGQDPVNFQQNDIIIGEPTEGRTIVGKIKENTFVTLEQSVDIMMDGRILT